jgi:hypothetical protein
MRPKFILVVMLVTLAFFLLLMISPGFWHRKAVGRAVAARIESPTAENIRAVKLEQARARRSQYAVCGLTVLNVMAIILYGAIQQRKGTI